MEQPPEGQKRKTNATFGFVVVQEDGTIYIPWETEHDG